VAAGDTTADHGTARGDTARASARAAAFDDRIYVFTPQATIIDLPADGTPLDFAYALHTELGHRCRGARVDGAMVPLYTALRSGQTVELTVAKEGGPSMDWLNTEAGYLKSPRARAKVRAWFNAQAQAQTIARGREAVDKLLQREGRTAIKLDTLAAELGFADADALFAVVGKDEFSLRHIEQLLRPAEPPADADDGVVLQRPRSAAGAPGKGSVLVVGMDSLLTSLARCCRPAPPDAIVGFVTRGRGVAIHRSQCANLQQMASAAPERVIEVQWAPSAPGGSKPALYPLDLLIDAQERPGLLRDISEMLAKDKVNITAMQTLRGRAAASDGVRLALAVEVADTARLPQVLGRLERVPGVRHARRR
jgi:GTP pyrophosphokinase